jgi:hypothetical protein
MGEPLAIEVLAGWAVLLGLSLALVGSALLIWDEMRSSAAGIRDYLEKHEGKLKGNLLKRCAFFAAKQVGSADVRAQQVYLSESFPRRFWGFGLLVLGMLAQALGVIFSL